MAETDARDGEIADLKAKLEDARSEKWALEHQVSVLVQTVEILAERLIEAAGMSR